VKAKYSILILFAFFAETTAIAQSSQDIDIIKIFNELEPMPTNQILSDEILKSAKTLYKDSKICSPNSVVIESAVPATAVRFVVEGVGRRTIKNAWSIIVRFPECGAEISKYNVVRQYDDNLYTFRVNRGRSNANESLINDTLFQTIALSQVVLKRNKVACDSNDFKLGVIRVSNESADLGPDIFGVRYKGSWQEIWPINLCGRTVEVAVDFKADGSGGAYTGLKGENTKLLPASN
jgi:hypothetical protein